MVKFKVKPAGGKHFELDNWVETVHQCLIAAGGSEDIDELERQMDGMSPVEFIRSQFKKAQEDADITLYDAFGMYKTNG